jgi:(2Fe-2S) ferredoxin
MMLQPMYDRHVFVCTNVKDGGKPSCGARGSAEICETMKTQTKAHPALRSQRLRVNKSGCLGLCEEGPTIVVYPEAVWYTGVALQDVPELIESHLVNGQSVARFERSTDPAKNK